MEDRGWDGLEGITDSMDMMSWSKLWEIVKDREAWRAAVYRVEKSWRDLVTEQQEWLTELGKRFTY